MPYFLKKGNTYQVTPKESLVFVESLPVGTYNVGRDCSGNFFLEAIENLEHKGKLYGNTTRNADRILRTFLDRSGTTGVLLSGAKGSGKTLLAKMISIQAGSQHNIPTLVINQALYGESFSAFIQMIDQPMIVLFDEFEKVYSDDDAQEGMLTLLDGVYPSKKLFLFTANDKYGINVNMRNRPGRIFYMLDFAGVHEDFVRGYCQDNLLNQTHIEKVCAISALFATFNFDILKGMVEEMNRYDETPSEVLRFLNARPDYGDSESFSVELSLDGKVLTTKENDVRDDWNGNPIKEGVSISYTVYNEKKEPEPEPSYERVQFSARNLEKLDTRRGVYTFCKNDTRLVLTRKRRVALDLEAFCNSRNFGMATVEETASQEGQVNDISMLPIDDGDY